MQFGIVIWIWCIGFIFFLFMLIFSKLAKLKQLVEYLGFRIIADIAVESEHGRKVLKNIVKEALREELSRIKIKELGDDKKNNK